MIMKRQLMIVLLVVATLFAGLPSSSRAQEEAPPETMTQGDLAKILASKLGLSPELPADASPAVAINMLKQAGISPRGGWNPDEEVTLGSLAVLLSQILGIVPQNPEDDASVVEACTAAGVDFSSVASALKSAGIIDGELLIVPTGSQLNDPLLRLPPGAPWQYFSRGGGGEGGIPFRPPQGPGGGPTPPFVPPGPQPLTPN